MLLRIFALAYSSPLQPCGPQVGLCIAGTAFSYVHTDSVAACCLACQKDSRCAAWNLKRANVSASTGQCALKDHPGVSFKSVICLSSGHVRTSPPTPVPPPTPAPKKVLAFDRLFRGGAVLQRSSEVKVFGMSGAREGSNVTVVLSVAGEINVTVHGEIRAGNWTVCLLTPSASFESTLTATDGTGMVSAKVSIGEVILCSGQSNMQMPVGGNNKTGFQADNGTAAAAASSRYAGHIFLASSQTHVGWLKQEAWNTPSPPVVSTFSAVCWYSGTALFERLKGNVPIGLIEAAVGGSPIEYWLPRSEIRACESDTPVCDSQLNESVFYDAFIAPLQPYTLGGLVWDQAERDVKCNHTDRYACMERRLVADWRRGFSSDFSVVVIQLPGYYDPIDVANGVSVFPMRLAQEAGLESSAPASIVATYDLSCPLCPFGSVHNLDKTDVGARVAVQLQRFIELRASGTSDLVFEGPRATRVTSSVAAHSNAGALAKTYTVSIVFQGGTVDPLILQGTRNCTLCCNASSGGDFTASSDGQNFFNGTVPVVPSGVGKSGTVQFTVELQAPPRVVRYTAGALFPQCAVYNQEGLPALPFELRLP